MTLRRPIRAIALACVLAATAAPGTARAQNVGSGSGGAEFWEALLVVTAVGGAVLVVAPIVHDIARGADGLPPLRGWAIGQAVGGGIGALMVTGVVVSEAQKPDARVMQPSPRMDEGWAAITAVSAGFAAFAGYGVGALLDPDAPKAGPIGAVVGVTAVATARAAATIGGVPHGPNTSLTQMALAVPGIAAGAFWAADAKAPRDRDLALALVGVSGVVFVHGVVDAIVYRPPAPPAPPAPPEAAPARPRASIHVAPTWLHDGRRAIPALGVGGTF